MTATPAELAESLDLTTRHMSGPTAMGLFETLLKVAALDDRLTGQLELVVEHANRLPAAETLSDSRILAAELREMGQRVEVALMMVTERIAKVEQAELLDRLCPAEADALASTLSGNRP